MLASQGWWPHRYWSVANMNTCLVGLDVATEFFRSMIQRDRFLGEGPSSSEAVGPDPRLRMALL